MVLKKIIITGSQGTGKSTLLKYMSNEYCVAKEVSREVIIEQQLINASATPWLDIEEYSNIVLERMIEQYKNQKSEICIYDRAIPDVIAYLKLKNKEVPSHFYEASKKHLKGATVFFTPLWKEIYKTDLQRPESYNETIIISRLIRETYKQLGFEIIDLFKENIEKRYKFVDTIIKRNI